MLRSSLGPSGCGPTFSVLLLLGVLAVPTTAQNTWRVSGDSAGVEGNDIAYEPAISEDGRYVAFASEATTLVPGDTNGERDVFVHDRLTGVVRRVSVDSAGVQGNGRSTEAAISGDGLRVAFSSYSSNLVASDTNKTWDVFLHNLQTGTTVLISADSGGTQGNGWGIEPAVSLDGRFVAFSSDSSNLVAGDTNVDWDVFMHDLQSGATTRVSVSSAGNQATGSSFRPSLSRNGRWLSFQSDAADLVLGDTNGRNDVFVHDRQTGATSRVSVDSSGAQGDATSQMGSISADGSCVAFDSDSTNLVAGDTNWDWDVFVHSRNTGVTTRVSVDSSGAQANRFSFSGSLSENGRYVAYFSMATNLVVDDSNGAMDIFLQDRVNGAVSRLSVSNTGVQGNSSSQLPAITPDARFVAFESYSSNLVAADTNATQDIFVHGPHLTLEADPEVVVAGSALSLTVWTGQASGLAMLAAVDINGTPTFTRVLSGKFDGNGTWSLSGTVPSSLAGNVITFLAFGIAPSGKAEVTNTEIVTIQ